MHMPVIVLLKILFSAQMFVWLLICQGSNSDDILFDCIAKINRPLHSKPEQMRLKSVLD